MVDSVDTAGATLTLMETTKRPGFRDQHRAGVSRDIRIIGRRSKGMNVNDLLRNK